ncbi:IPTL-CTERM sorting domain-containing protein [Acidovorax sp.]|uniref:IPTL-CTERM sorting domain-containing protein n=1 Tax=Acidovorax sp. TaxID=1872122 RepID=UPI003918DE7C
MRWKALSAFAAHIAALCAFLVSLSASAAPTLRTLDSVNVGEYSSLKVDASGRPVISYYDRGNGDLKLVRCSDATCTSATPVTLDGPTDVGQYSSLQLTAAGNPVISYYDANGFDPNLKIAVCGDPGCLTSTIVLLDNTGFLPIGRFTSLRLSPTGVPVVAYADLNAGGQLKLVRCQTTTCSTVHPPVVIDDPATLTGSYASLALDGDIPVISYYDDFNGDLRLARCTDAACSGVTRSTLDASGTVGLHTSIQLNGSNPVISYYDQSSDQLKLAACANPACGAVAIRILSTGGGQFSSLHLGPTGNPIVSFRGSGSSLRLAVCHDPTCAAVTVSTVDTGNTGFDTSLALGANGMPVVSYHDATATSLRLAAFALATVTSVAVPAAGNYLTGQALEFQVHWSENVTVTGTPQLEIDIGGTLRTVSYTSGSGTSIHTFSYTVIATDQDLDGIALGNIVPSGGTLRDGAGLDAEIGLTGVGSTALVRVNALALPTTATAIPTLSDWMLLLLATLMLPAALLRKRQ